MAKSDAIRVASSFFVSGAANKTLFASRTFQTARGRTFKVDTYVTACHLNIHRTVFISTKMLNQTLPHSH
jgi:uncharacterized protein with NAD-binding domain and iron-sulfur cluster